MSRGVKILLEEILEAIELLQRYTAGQSLESFIENVEKQDSVTRREAHPRGRGLRGRRLAHRGAT